tara:strand:- start:127 stop:369 length:243 start_codon:yes stop_codon:yes gene_type:complete
MKAELHFNLDDYDDKIEHLKCVQASDLCSAVWEFLNNTRETLTENAVKQNIDVDDAIVLVYRTFWEILEERNINIDKLIQ